MALTITTKSTTSTEDFKADRTNCFYPIYVDNTPYLSWIDPTPFAIPDVSTCSFPYFQLKATGGTVASWAILSGSLPRGMTLDPLTGRISGTPNKIGLYTFVVEATGTDGSKATKTLSWIAKPERARWMREVEFAVITQWSKISAPYSAHNFFDNTQLGGVNCMVPGFMEQLVLNAEADAAYDAARGIKYREVCVSVDFSMFRMSPSPTLLTRFNDHSPVNIVKQYIDAYHAQGIKVGCYTAPNFIYNVIPGPDPYALTDGDRPFGNWSPPMKVFMEGWVDDGLDVFLFDVGGSWDYYVPGFANPGSFQLHKYIPYWRYKNPDFMFAHNPGTRTNDCKMGGAQIHYPHSDGYIFEQTFNGDQVNEDYERCTPPMNRKKVFIYSWQLPTYSFGFKDETLTAPLKDMEDTKRVMDMTWENGCTFGACHPVKSTGEYPTAELADYFDEMYAYAKDSGGYSSFVEYEYKNGTVTITSAPDEVIYYTTDGSYPTIGSPVYTGPIKIKRYTHFRARSKKAGKLLGHVEDGWFGEDLDVVSDGKLAFSIDSVKNVTHVTDPANSFRGMHLAVFNKDIIVEAFGRQVSGTSTVDHELIIKRRADEFNHFFGKLDHNAPIENGYQWVPTGGLRLQAGALYWIAFKEGTVDTYASNPMTVNPMYNLDDYRIKGNAIGSPLGDLIPLNANFNWYQWWSVGGNYNVGQFINMKYRVVENGDPDTLGDLLYGRDATMTDNSGSPAVVNGGIRVATNANNNLPDVYAMVGGIYAWTWGGLLEKPKWVNRVEVEFKDENSISTQIEIHGTLNSFPTTSTTLMATKLDNKSPKVVFTFPKRFVNRIYVKSILPNAAGQIGGGMVLRKVSAYLK